MKKANFILSFTFSGKALHSLTFLFCSRMSNKTSSPRRPYRLIVQTAYLMHFSTTIGTFQKSVKKNWKKVRQWQQSQALTRALEQANWSDTIGQRKYVHTVQGRGCRSFSFETDLYWWTWGEETRDREEEAVQSSGSWESLNEHSPEE